MSRIGRQPIKLPSGVTADIKSDSVSVSGPKGNLSLVILPGIKVEQNGDQLIVTRSNDEASSKAKHGLMRALLNNLVVGVSEGFSKTLEINGVGYRANLEGQSLKLSIGYSHNVIYTIPDGIKVGVDQNILTISGIDRQKVGQVAAEIRALKKPEPYKGKGIKYSDERILRKSGKSGKEKTA